MILGNSIASPHMNGGIKLDSVTEGTGKPMDEQVVLITGGGSGIGLAAARQFLAQGARVLITGRRADVLAEAVATHPKLTSIVADVRVEADAARVVAAAIDRWGRVDVLVNNAGAFAAAPLSAVTADQVMNLFATNVLGPTLLTRAALPHLRLARGAVINVSSTYGHKAAAFSSHYAASKAALEHLTRCWALELAPDRIRVNAVAPGPTETPILAQSGLPAAAVEAIKRQEADLNPLGRRGTAEEVAAWIVALANPAATWITGQVISIDGGLSA